jgi:hypothetical protein
LSNPETLETFATQEEAGAAPAISLTGVVAHEISFALNEFLSVRLGPELWDALRAELNAGENPLEITDSISMNGIRVHRAEHASPKSITVLMGGFVVSRIETVDC